MIGALIGGALALGSSIFGGIKASQAAEEAKGIKEAQKRKNQAWYDRNYYEDPTQRADAQRVLTETTERMRQRNKAAEGTAAVAGASEESVANTKASSAQAMAEAASQIAARGEARKDSVDQQYRERDAALDDQLAAIEQNRAANIAKAAQGVGSAAGSLAMGLDGMNSPDTSATNGTGKVAGPTDVTKTAEELEEERWKQEHMNGNNIS